MMQAEFIPFSTDYSVTQGSVLQMVGAIVSVILFLALFIGICSAIIWMQLFLSRKKNMWLGLIMPIASFAFSIVIVFNIVAFSSFQTEMRVERVLYSYAVHLERLDEVYEAAGNIECPEEYALLAEIEAFLEDRVYNINQINHLTDYGHIRFLPIGRVTFIRVTFIFLAFNIPTIFLLIIYASCRGKRRHRRAVEIMSLQDLG